MSALGRFWSHSGNLWHDYRINPSLWDQTKWHKQIMGPSVLGRNQTWGCQCWADSGPSPVLCGILYGLLPGELRLSMATLWTCRKLPNWARIGPMLTASAECLLVHIDRNPGFIMKHLCQTEWNGLDWPTAWETSNLFPKQEKKVIFLCKTISLLFCFPFLCVFTFHGI